MASIVATSPRSICDTRPGVLPGFLGPSDPLDVAGPVPLGVAAHSAAFAPIPSGRSQARFDGDGWKRDPGLPRQSPTRSVFRGFALVPVNGGVSGRIAI